MVPGIDDRLAQVLGARDAGAIARWARQVGVALGYADWEDCGNTAARLVAVYAEWDRFGDTPEFSGKLIMKYVPFDWRETEEPRRTADAWNDSSTRFRDSHLVRQRRDPVMLPDGGWVMFVDVAGGSLAELRSLSTLLGRTDGPGLVLEHAAVVVSTTLAEWTPRARPKFPTIGEHLRELLAPRLDSTGTVRRWAREHGLVTGEQATATTASVARFPNPYALVLGDHPSSARKIRVRYGRSHRDLHVGNILVGLEPGRFLLIDQARFHADWPLAFDPMYLLVTTVAHFLPGIASPDHRADLILLLVEPDSGLPRWVPKPLHDLVVAIMQAVLAAAPGDNVVEEWRTELLLSLTACALVMTGRDLIAEPERLWFLELAACAAATVTGLPLSGPEITRASAALREPVAAPASRAPEADLPAPVSYAIPRLGLLSKMTSLHRDRPGGLVALVGPPGVGKTQLAVQYVGQHGGEYARTFWLSGETPSLLTEQFTEFVHSLGVPVASGSDLDSLRRAAFATLRIGGRYLLVFDGIATAATIRQFWPPSSNVDVLVTSRSPQWTQMGRTLEVAGFERGESLRLLTEVVGDKPGLDELAEALNDLPAAVAQAAHFMVGSRVSVRSYREMVLEDTMNTLRRGLLNAYGAPLAAVWANAIDRLGEDDREAADAVTLIAFFGQAPIPAELVVVPTSSASATCPPSDEVVRSMVDSGLVSVSDGVFHCYPLLQSFIREHVTPARADPIRSAVRAVLVANDPGDPREPTTWRRFHSLLPHIVDAGASAPRDRAFLAVYLRTAHYLTTRGDSGLALDLAERALAEWRDDAEATIEAMRHVAQAHFHSNDHELASRVDAEVLVRTRRLFGEDHSESLAAEKNAAASRAAVKVHDRMESLEPLLAHVVSRHRRLLGVDHPETLRAVHNLAHELRSSGRPDRALELDRKNHSRFTEVLGQLHVDTLKSAHALGLDLRGSGHHGAAADLNACTHRALFELLGPGHPDTAQSAVSLAEDRRRAGHPSDARTLGTAAYETLVAVRGLDHPLTLLAAHGLGKDLLALNDLDEALRVARETYRRRGGVLGAGHVETIRSGSLLARVFHRSGQAELALALDAEVRILLEDLRPEGTGTTTGVDLPFP